MSVTVTTFKLTKEKMDRTAHFQLILDTMEKIEIKKKKKDFDNLMKTILKRHCPRD